MSNINSLNDQPDKQKCFQDDDLSFNYREASKEDKYYKYVPRGYSSGSRRAKRKINYSNKTISRSVSYTPRDINELPFEVKQLSTEIRRVGNEESELLDRKVAYYKELLQYYSTAECDGDISLRFCPKQFCSLMISLLKNIWNSNNKAEDTVDLIVYSRAAYQMSPQYDYYPETLRAHELSDPESLAWPIPSEKARQIFISDAHDLLMRPVCTNHYDFQFFYEKTGCVLADLDGSTGIRLDIGPDQRLIDFFENAKIDPDGEPLSRIIAKHEYFKGTGIPISTLNENGLNDEVRALMLRCHMGETSKEGLSPLDDIHIFFGKNTKLGKPIPYSIIRGRDAKIPGRYDDLDEKDYRKNIRPRMAKKSKSSFNGSDIHINLVDNLDDPIRNLYEVRYGPIKLYSEESYYDEIKSCNSLDCTLETPCGECREVIVNTSTSSGKNWEDSKHLETEYCVDCHGKENILIERELIKKDELGKKLGSEDEESSFKGVENLVYSELHPEYSTIKKDRNTFCRSNTVGSNAKDGDFSGSDYDSYSICKNLVSRSRTCHDLDDNVASYKSQSDVSLIYESSRGYSSDCTIKVCLSHVCPVDKFGICHYLRDNKLKPGSSQQCIYSPSFITNSFNQGCDTYSQVSSNTDFNTKNHLQGAEVLPNSIGCNGYSTFGRHEFSTKKNFYNNGNRLHIETVRIGDISFKNFQNSSQESRNLNQNLNDLYTEDYYTEKNEKRQSDITGECIEYNVSNHDSNKSHTREFGTRKASTDDIYSESLVYDIKDDGCDVNDGKFTYNVVDEDVIKLDNSTKQYTENYELMPLGIYYKDTNITPEVCMSGGEIRYFTGTLDIGDSMTSTPMKNDTLRKHSTKSSSYDVLSKKSMDRYSRKVFVGGLPQDITEEQLYEIFSKNGDLVIDWPYKSNSINGQLPKGYAFLLFRDANSVTKLLQDCLKTHGKNYVTVSSNRSESKQVQIRTWIFTDAHYENILLKIDHPDDSWREYTIFLGGIPRQTTAREVAIAFEKEYGPVVEAHIDVDSEFRYPKGAASVQFLTKKSFFSTLKNRYVCMKLGGIDKKLEIKPYYSDDKKCQHKELEKDTENLSKNSSSSIYFCGDYECLKFFCSECWSYHFESHGGDVQYFVHSVNNSKVFNRKYDDHQSRREQHVPRSSWESFSEESKNGFFKQTSMNLNNSYGPE